MSSQSDPMAGWIGDGPPLPGVRTVEGLHEVLSRPAEQVLMNAEFAGAQRHTLTITSQTEWEAALVGTMKPWNVVRVNAILSSDAVPCVLAVRWHPTFETSRKITHREEALSEVALSAPFEGLMRPTASLTVERGTTLHCMEVEVIPLQTVGAAFTASVCVEFSLVSRPC